MNDDYYMNLALQLAESARGQTSPNPLVGAVVVNDSHIVGFGAHLKAGKPHAEVHAILMAKEKARGATIYVTLEPCNHYGKTPPCTDLIIESGIKRVVIATVDPNPKVSGSGIEKLKRAGIEVTLGVCEKEATELNRWFFHSIKEKRPYTTIKIATTMDGKIATKTNDSKYVTSKEARGDVHWYRHQYDAILVGINTVLFDQPSLTTRLENGGIHPIRVILDTHLKTPIDAHVTDQCAPTWIFTTHHADEEKTSLLEEKGVRVFKLCSDHIAIQEVVSILGQEGILSLFVEGGAKVNGSFLAADLIDEVIQYTAPKLVGGIDAKSAFYGEGIEKMNDAYRFDVVSVEKIGPDIKAIFRRRRGC